MPKSLKMPARVSLRTAVKASGMVAASALCLAVLVRPTEDAVANGETRSLSMQHMHTGESIEITYKRNGQYDSAALQKLNWFLRDWRRKEPTRMDPRLFDTVWLAYKETRANQPIHVLCGYRAPETNEMLRHRSRVTGVAKFSQHTLGKAMDFYIPGVNLSTLRVAGLHLQRGGVGFYPTSGSPFVHMDAGSVRMWPRMSRAQLASVFPDGKTVYLPAEGGKMPRYQEAFAEVMRQGGAVGGFQGSGGEDDGGGSDAAPASGGLGLFAGLFGGGRNAASDTATVRDNARVAKPVAAEPVVVAAANRPDPRAANQALASLAGPAVASTTAARSVVAMNDALDDMPAPKVTTTQTAAVAMPVALPVPAPARPAGPQMAWATGAQPVSAEAAPAANVPLPPIPDPSMRAASPILAAMPPLPPTRPADAPVQVAMLDADQAPASSAPATAIPAPPVRPQMPVLQPGKPVTAAVASVGDLPRQFLQGTVAADHAVGQALGYAAPEPVIAAPVVQPKVEFVAVSFDQVDFGALASPVTASRDRAQTELYAPDLNAGAGMLKVAYRMGPQRLAMHPLRTAGFAGATLASVN